MEAASLLPAHHVAQQALEKMTTRAGALPVSGPSALLTARSLQLVFTSIHHLS